MDPLNALTQILFDLPLYALNGLLAIAYWLAANLPALASVAAAGLMALLPDAEIQRRAGYRPRRGDRGLDGEGVMPRTAQVITGIVLATWLLAQWGMGAPVPWIGAAMWLAGLLAVLALPAQRFNLTWYAKAGIALYALAVLGSRLYLAYTAQLTPDRWAALIGSSESAAAVIAGTRGSVTTIILWALWLVVPLGYFSMLVQQAFVNPMSIVSPMAGAQDVLRSLRVRE
ncbi:MAG: hypothetical protein ACOYYS_17705 [Chloroflexota bacterium]